MIDYTHCPTCGRRGLKAVGDAVRTCPKCGAIFGQCSLDESYVYVRPRYILRTSPAEWRYFDFLIVEGDEVYRRHGWYDPATRCITQIG